MAYIYLIRNDINDKVYIGKTLQKIETRFKAHLYNAKNNRTKGSILYKAIRKYGQEHFSVELLEETDNPEERECFWIKQFDSFHNGYNATPGGDGRPWINRQLVLTTYAKVGLITETSKILGVCKQQVSAILKENNIKVPDNKTLRTVLIGVPVMQYSKDGVYLRTFSSVTMALESLNNPSALAGQSHILDACKGKRKTAYGYVWKFAN